MLLGLHHDIIEEDSDAISRLRFHKPREALRRKLMSVACVSYLSLGYLLGLSVFFFLFLLICCLFIIVIIIVFLCSYDIRLCTM